MALPELRRQSDNKLLSDKSVSWNDWQETYNAPVLHTITNVPYIQSRIGVMYEKSTIRFKFSEDYPDSTPDNHRDIVNAHRNLSPLSYTDVTGEVFDVYVYERGQKESDPRERLKRKFYVDVTLMKAGFLR